MDQKILQGIMTIREYLQCVIDGFIDMVDMVVILMLGYAMQEVMDTMGMEGLVQMICQMIPIPVMIVVLAKLGANLPLCIGAIVSAGCIF